MNCSKKHCKQIAFKIHCTKFHTDMVEAIECEKIHHRFNFTLDRVTKYYSRTKKIYRYPVS